VWVVAADIGGTSCRLTSASLQHGRAPEIRHRQRYISGEFPRFDTLLSNYLDDAALGGEAIDLLVLAVPGVIHDQRVRLTNLDWTIDSDELRQRFPVARVILINDFQAAALGVDSLQPAMLRALNAGQPVNDGLRVITGAGTGLGMAYHWPGLMPGVTEGGHVDFAPLDGEQDELLRFLRGRYPEHVSYERILSGMGLTNLHAFCAAGTAPATVAEQVTAAAHRGEPSALRALGLFFRILAAYCGNLALMFQPFGGIYIAGGIAPKIAEWLNPEEFIAYYSRKGRMSSLASRVPVYLVLDEDLGLNGSLAAALQHLHTHA